MEDLDGALWDIVDRKSYVKHQPKDAQLCIEAGANVNCERPMGYPCDEDPSKRETPLLIAITRYMPKMVKRLLALGADPSALTGASDGRTVLHVTAVYDLAEIAGMLIKAGVSIEKKDTFGWTALHLAVFECHRHHLTVRMLLANGANVNAMDDTGRTPLQIVLEYGGCFSNELKEILIENGADLSDKVVDGSYPEGEFAWKEKSWENWMKTMLKKERHHSGRRSRAFAMRQQEEPGAGVVIGGV
jgi:ankyrin repeat protein